MTRLVQVAAVLLAAVSATPLAASSAEAASGLAARQRCRAAAERIWPTGTGAIGEYNRNRRYLFISCMNNGGQIPD